MKIFPYNCILIYGPTASGKTFFSITIAEFLLKNFGIESEIINSDSIQLYNDLKILTNFPSKEELNAFPSHLFGVLNPLDHGNVNFWFEQTNKIISKLKSQKILIICGGTGMYLFSLINGIPEIPPISNENRKFVKNYFEKIGRNQFFEELNSMDPEHKISKNDTQRLKRAFEVAKFTSHPLSYWWEKNKKLELPYLLIKLIPDSNELKKTARQRIQKMLKVGAVEEVEIFSNNYKNYSGSLKKVIGYNEIVSFLKNEISKDEMVELMNIHTEQYIKKQTTWARNKLKNAITIYAFGNQTSCIRAFCDIINTGKH